MTPVDWVLHSDLKLSNASDSSRSSGVGAVRLGMLCSLQKVLMRLSFSVLLQFLNFFGDEGVGVGGVGVFFGVVVLLSGVVVVCCGGAGEGVLSKVGLEGIKSHSSNFNIGLHRFFEICTLSTILQYIGI